MPSTVVGEADHLAHPGPGLGGGEVGADPGAQVAGGADVEHPGARRRGTGRRRARGAAPRRGGACGAGRCDTREEKVCSSSRVCTPRPPSRSISPCSTSTVARASESARWLGVVDGVEGPRQRGQLAVGRVVAGDHPAGQLGGVDHLERRPRRGPAAAAKCLRKPTSNGALWATRTLPGANSRNAGSADSIGGASATIELVMPVSTAMNAGISVVRVDQGLELAEHLAAAHLDRADLGDHRAAPRPSRRWSRGRRRRT